MRRTVFDDDRSEFQRALIALPIALLIVGTALYGMAHSTGVRRVPKANAVQAELLPAKSEGPQAVAHPPIPADARYFESAHYGLHSTADPEISLRILNRAERARTELAGLLPIQEGPLMRMRLARDQAEFQKWFPRRRWAEGLYLRPVSYAYADAQEQRPDQWLIHESIHQVLREQTPFHPPRWIEEGFASYIASATVTDTDWDLGNLDPHTYPTWWFIGTDPVFWTPEDGSYWPRNGMVPISVLIGHVEGPPLNQSFNSYYVSSMLLVHYLMHGAQGRHRTAFLRYLQSPGTPADFERRIGRISVIQAQWEQALPAQLAAGNPVR